MTLDDMIRELEESAAVYDVGSKPRAYWDDRLACLRAVKAELEAARAVVAKLPMLADGTRFVPGMTIYTARQQCWRNVLSISDERGLIAMKGFSTVVVPSDCYSTRAAAEAAREAKEKP